MNRLITFACSILLLMSCNGIKTEEELYEMTQSGSVLVYNKFYYEITTPSGDNIYFSSIDENGNFDGFETEQEEVMKHSSVLTGTAFFIDDAGTMMTNRHVAYPDLDEQTAKEGYQNFINAIGYLYQEKARELSDSFDSLEYEKENNCVVEDEYGSLSYDEEALESINEQEEALKSAYSELMSTMQSLRNEDNADAIRVRTVCKIGIAYNDTYVTEESDLLVKNACVQIRKSEKENCDLALIQLKDKKTPDDRFIFSLAGKEGKSALDLNAKNDDGTLKMGQQLYMIGYNSGLRLANTQVGIKVQMTAGKVTQLSDGQRILYDIATSAGSSGSPVIDEHGNLVAVNFAKLNGTDNFNFGIPAEQIKEFMGW